MQGQLIPSGVTFGVGRNSLNDFFSGSAVFNTLTATSINSTTISGGTLYSGSTDLYSIFLTTNDGNDITRVQPGTNTFTGGTENAPTVNLTSATLANLSTSGTNTATQFSATTLSGGTILSGSTDLYSIFLTTTSAVNSPFSGNSITGAIAPISGSNIASGSFALVAGGKSNLASGTFSHAEGYQTTSSGSWGPHSEGYKTTSSGGFGSHAEGFFTIASGSSSHAEGAQTTSLGTRSHAEGQSTTASGSYSHAEGHSTIASGSYSHAGGFQSSATSTSSFVYSRKSIVNAAYSSILGGSGNTINTNVTGSTILGSSNITAKSSNTAYATNLTATTVYSNNIKLTGSINSIPTSNVGNSTISYREITTNATPGLLVFNAANEFDLGVDLNGSVSYDIMVSATQISGTSGTTRDSRFWVIRALITCDGAGNSTLISSSTTSIAASAGAAAWSTSVGAGFPLSPLNITITGEVGKNIVWQAVARTSVIYI